MKLLSLFLLVTVVPLVAKRVAEVQVRVVTFEMSGATTALEAARPGCDEKLFAQLSAGAAAGNAKIVHDQSINVRSGQRSKVEAVREYPRNSEMEARPSEWFQYPFGFQYHNLGQNLEVEATVSEDGMSGMAQRLIDVNMAPECSSLLTLHPWPVPDLRGSGQMGRVLQPVFAVHKVTTQAFAWTGRTTLISVAVSPPSALTDSAEPSFRYTFLRAGVDGEKPASAGSLPATPVRERRLHAVTIRLPRQEAAALLLQQTGDDAALYAELSRRVAAGTATVSGHSAIHCRDGQRSKLESTVTFHVPDEYNDLIPDGWNSFPPGPGHELEVEAQPSGDSGVSGDWEWAYDSRERLELARYHPDERNPSLHGAMAEYVERKLHSLLLVPASGILCGGVSSTSPATEEEEASGGLTDILFVLQSPPPGRVAAEREPHSNLFLHSFILSVPTSVGATLAAAVKSKAAPAPVESLIRRLASGQVTCAAHAATAIRAGHRSTTRCVRRVQHPGDFQPSTVDPEIALPGSWSFADCGVILDVEYLHPEDIGIDATLEWDSAPVLSFGEPGAKIPDISARRCTQKIELDDLRLKLNEPIIADVRPSNARAGTPEHGRWHVLILLAR